MSGVPSGWAATTLGDVARVVRNGLFKTRPSDQPPGVPILRISAVRPSGLDLTARKYVQDVSDDELKKFSVVAGDLLLTRYNGSRHLVGMAALVPYHAEGLIYPDKLIRVALDPLRADARFVNYQLASPRVRTFLEPRIRTTAGQSGISGVDVKATPLVLPAIGEQRRIVDLLEDHLSRLDAADRSVRDSVGRLEALRLATLRGVLVDLRGSDAEESPLGQLADTRLGKMLDAKRASGADTPYLRNINVRWGSIDLADVKSVPLSDSERQELALEPGDLLVCEGGEPGRCAIWPGSDELMTFQKALHRVRVHPQRLAPEFAAVVLEAVVRTGELDRTFTGTTIKHLPQERLRAVRIPVPNLAQQRELVARLRSMDEYAGRLASQLQRLEVQSGGLRRALLGAAFSGRLTGRSVDNDLVEEFAAAGV